MHLQRDHWSGSAQHNHTLEANNYQTQIVFYQSHKKNAELTSKWVKTLKNEITVLDWKWRGLAMVCKKIEDWQNEEWNGDANNDENLGLLQHN